MREWLTARGFEDDPYGHQSGVQRNLRLYPGQKAHLDRLALELKRARVQGARSKLICAVMHHRKPSGGKEAIQILRDAQQLIGVL